MSEPTVADVGERMERGFASIHEGLREWAAGLQACVAAWPVPVVHSLTADITSLCGAAGGRRVLLRRYVTCPDCLTLLTRRDGGA